MPEPISIYCDWALHDELGDNVRLTEELTMGALDTLDRWQREHDVAFDYYLLDCFWFEQPGDYTSFDPETWPSGFEPARQRMQQMGMTPGLWLDTTGAAVAGWHPWQGGEGDHGWGPWADSLDCRSGWSYCLFDGPYADGLCSAMVRAVEEWGVGMFKFDFANFYAVTERHRGLDAGEVYRRNVNAFKDILRRVRSVRRDVVFLAYNGFRYNRGYLDNTTDALVPGIEQHWLELIDWLYSGDPRPADLPCTSLRRAVDFYQDHMVRKFHHSRIPLDRIDDHGCMVGKTNTIYYFGARGFRRTWVQSLARGGRKAHFYGDPALLSDDDVEFLRRAQELFFNLFQSGAVTKPVGGVPCQSAGHGFLTGTGEDGVLLLANSSGAVRTATVPIKSLETAKVLFHDEGFVPECTVHRNVLSATLAPEQVALVGLGERADESFELGTNVGGDPVVARTHSVNLDWTHEDGVTACTLPVKRLVEAMDEGRYDTLRVSFRLRQDGRAYRHAFERDKAPTETLRVECLADGTPVKATQLLPDVKVWSGCSWVTALYSMGDLSTATEASVSFHCPDPEPELFAEAWLQGG